MPKGVYNHIHMNGDNNISTRIEVRQKIKLSLIGNNNGKGNKGIPKSEEHKKKMSLVNKGKKLSEETKKKISNSTSLEKNPNWNGGKTIRHGRIYLLTDNGYIQESRLVMEQFLGRKLVPKIEVVHHINGLIDDNRIENLMLFNSNSEHIKYHNIL